MDNLPKEVTAHLLFNYLDIDSISKCYLTNKVFNCLNETQLNIMKHVRKGFLDNVKEGRLDVCKWIKGNLFFKLDSYHLYNSDDNVIYEYTSSAFVTGCYYGHLELCKWLHSLNELDIYDNYGEAFKMACINRSNCQKIYKWLYELSVKEGKPFDIISNDGGDEAFDLSCHNGRLGAAKYLYDLSIKNNKPLHISNYNMVKVCENGHAKMLKMLKWMHNLTVKNGYPSNIHEGSELLFRTSCHHGHLNISYWLYNLCNELGDPIDIYVLGYDLKSAFMISCALARLETCKWLYNLSIDDGKPFDIYNKMVLIGCIVSGNLKICKWLYNLSVENGKPLDIINGYDDGKCPLAFSCNYKYLDISKWLYSIVVENGLSIDSNVIINSFVIIPWNDASENNEEARLKMLQWLYDLSIENGEPITNEKLGNIFRKSCINGLLKISKLLYTLIDNKYIYNNDNCRAFRGACKYGHLDTCKWLYNLSIKDGKTIDITINKHYAFTESFRLRQFDVSNWLASICPDRYKLKFIDGKPDYEIIW